MSERRRKRRLVNAVLVLLLIAAVLHLYVASSGAADWLVGRGTLELATATALDRTVFAPLDLYCNANGPGANDNRYVPVLESLEGGRDAAGLERVEFGHFTRKEAGQSISHSAGTIAGGDLRI